MWTKIAPQMPGRTDNMALQRYKRLLGWKEQADLSAELPVSCLNFSSACVCVCMCVCVCVYRAEILETALISCFCFFQSLEDMSPFCGATDTPILDFW